MVLLFCFWFILSHSSNSCCAGIAASFDCDAVCSNECTVDYCERFQLELNPNWRSSGRRVLETNRRRLDVCPDYYTSDARNLDTSRTGSTSSISACASSCNAVNCFAFEYSASERRCQISMPSNGFHGTNIYQYSGWQTCVRTGRVDGAWSSWSSWGSCFGGCGNGMRSRTRRCDNPPRANGGEYCQGDDEKVQICSLDSCGPDNSINTISCAGVDCSYTMTLTCSCQGKCCVTSSTPVFSFMVSYFLLIFWIH